LHPFHCFGIKAHNELIYHPKLEVLDRDRSSN
jgi:hypothetical protein